MNVRTVHWLPVEQRINYKLAKIVQDSALHYLSEPAPLVAHQRTHHLIVVRPTSVRAISTDIVILPDDRSARPHL